MDILNDCLLLIFYSSFISRSNAPERFSVGDLGVLWQWHINSSRTVRRSRWNVIPPHLSE